MNLSTNIGSSLIKYRGNAVLVVPALTAFSIQLISSIVFSDIAMRGNSLEYRALTIAQYFLVVDVVTAILSFLIILGRVSMSEKVVRGKKASFGDWGTGVTRYFSKVIWVWLAFGAITLLIILPTDFAYTILVQTRIIALWNHSRTEVLRMSALAGLAWHGLLVGLLGSIVQWLFYLCLASSVLDRKGFRASLKVSIAAVRKKRRVFFGLVLLFWAVSIMFRVIRDSPALIGIISQPKIGISNLSDVVSELLESVLSPVWFLSAFIFYVDAKAKP